MQRTLAWRRASSLTTAAVPSGELSSTTMNSKGISRIALDTRSNSGTMLSRSLKAGTMTASCGELQISCTGDVVGSCSIVTSISDFTRAPNYDGALTIRKPRLRSRLTLTQRLLDSVLAPSYIPAQLLAL